MRLDDVTVILPTCNEQSNILAFLESLPDRVSLIVVDASQDATLELVQRQRPAHTLVLRHPGNVAEARQVGAEAARTTWLLYTDADVVFAPDYFERLEGYHGYDVLYGPKLSSDEFTGYYRWFARGQQLLHWIGVPAASGSNLLITRHALFAAGGFDLRLSCNEDSELVWRVKWRGYPALFARDLVVYAKDHRRIRRGRARKTMHSVIRCALLFSDLMPDRWRDWDWGYWGRSQDIPKPGT